MSVKKTVRCLVSAFAALVMAFAMVTPAFAVSGTNDNSGQITISDAVPRETYSVYQIATLESYDTDNGNYAYKATADWLSFLNESKYVTVDDSEYVTWNDSYDDAASKAQFAKEALAYASQNGIDPTQTTEATTTTVKFEGLNLGWYLVDTSLGSICSLNTTATSANIEEKNDTPSISKKVFEDSGSGVYADKATIDVIDTIRYQLSVTVGAGVDGDYTITDVLPDGINFISDVEDANNGVSIEGWDTSDFEVTVPSDSNNNTLTITLNADKLEELDSSTSGSAVVITYSAIADANLQTNAPKTNEVTLAYKQQQFHSQADVVTYSIGGTTEDPTFTKVDGDQNELQGVGFVLKKGNLFAEFDKNGYLKAWSEEQTEDSILRTNENGNLFAYGLDADSYTLVEVDPLDGYNKLSADIDVTIAEDGTVSYSYDGTDDAVTVSGNSITVTNTSGVLLPTTGGMGTTALYAVGAVLVVGAGVTLVVRRRAHHEA